MPDVGQRVDDDPSDDVTAFVTELAEKVKAPWVRAACTQIQHRNANGVVPIGLQRLLAVATAPTSNTTPAPRRPSDEITGLPAAVGEHPFVVLESAGPVSTAAELAALLNDGRRVLVTAANRSELAEVQAAVPPEMAPLLVKTPVALSPAELRQLRGLLVTATDRRRSRLLQTLPAVDELPSLELVTRLCRQAGRGRAYTGTDVIPELLDALDPDGRAAVIEVARQTQHYLDELAGGPDSEWMWALLTRMVFHRDEHDFQQLTQDAGRAAAAVQAPRRMQVEVSGPVPPNAAQLLAPYVDYLEHGGRQRGLLRSAEQRAAEPVLRQIRIDGAVAGDAKRVREVLEFVELHERFERIVATCERLGVPAPAGVGDTVGLARRLDHLAMAAGSVSALRHAVLFIHPESPVAVPDLPTAQEVAAAIISYGGITEIVQAERELDALAEQVAVLAPGHLRAPEHQHAIDSLKMCDDTGYLQALDGMAGARREALDEARCDELLEQLEASSPELAQAWDEPEGEPLPFGYAWLTSASDLLAQLPGPDSADVVLVLGADTLGLEQLLVAAAAPRMVAVTTGVTPITAAPTDQPPTVLAVLRKLAAPVVWAGRVKTGGAPRKKRATRQSNGVTSTTGTPTDSAASQHAGAG